MIAPRKLNWSSSLVAFAREARPLGVSRIAVISLRTNLLLEAQAPSKWAIRCSGPPTCGFMGNLSEKRSNLTLARG